MDQIDAFIANLHSLLGHDKTAAFLGVDPGDKSDCVHCQYTKGQITKQQVQDHIDSRRRK